MIPSPIANHPARLISESPRPFQNFPTIIAIDDDRDNCNRDGYPVDVDCIALSNADPKSTSRQWPRRLNHVRIAATFRKSSTNLRISACACLLVGGAQQRRGMHRCERVGAPTATAPIGRDPASPGMPSRTRPAPPSLRAPPPDRGCTAAISAFEPRKAGLDLDRSRACCGCAAGPRGTHLKCFDDIGDVCPRPIDTRLCQTAVEELSRRSDKRVTGEVLGVSRLLADQHHMRALAGPSPNTVWVAVEIERACRAIGAAARSASMVGNRDWL